MFAFLASLFRAKAKPEAIPSRRIRAMVTSQADRVAACEWGGRDYWKG